MTGVLFGLIMIAVGWLVIWSSLNHARPGTGWSPFDFRTTDTAAPATDEPQRSGETRPARWNPKHPWHRSGF